MKIVSWNLEGRLSDLATGERGTPEKIVEAIKAFDADILVHPEAFGADKPVRPEIIQSLRDLGYTWESIDYDDLIDRGGKAVVPRPNLMVMSRVSILRHEVIRPGNLRNMLALFITDPESGSELRFIGIHLEDREEALRLKQVGPLIEYINSSDTPTIMMGDFNAMPPNTPKSSFINSALFRDPASLVPHAHIRYTMKRLSDMASGTTIDAILKQTNLTNADPKLTPTATPKMRRMEWLPSIPFAKIDWMFVSPGIEYADFAVSADLGSDHRALSASIHIAPQE